MRTAYPSDLTDEQYEVLKPYIPPAKPGGRPREVDIRGVINALFYINRTCCQWRYLPHDFPKPGIVYNYYKQWRLGGTWELFQRVLREEVREAAGKEPTPSMVIIDSQSVKATELGGEHGIDAHKKINGRKRHILVDTLGLILAAVVTSAATGDGGAAPRVMGQINQADFPRVKKLLVDQGYDKYQFPAWVAEHGYYEMEIAKKPPASEDREFKIIKWRWIVERTFAWIGRYRRHSRDYERNTESSRSMIQISSIQQMLNRLKPKKNGPGFRYRKTTEKPGEPF